MKFNLLYLFLLIFTIVNSQANLSTTNKKAAKLHAEAQKYYESGNNSEALDINLKSLGKDPQFIEALMLNAYIHLADRKPLLAIVSFEKAISLNPSFFPGNFLDLGGLYYKTGQYEKAISILNTYLNRYHPKNNVKQKAQYYLECAIFSKNAVEHPVPFNPVNLGPNVNSPLRDYNPIMNVEGNQLYFTRTIPDNVPSGAREDIFSSFVEKDNYSPARELGPPLNSQMREGAPSITSDGSRMIITICESFGDYGPQRNGMGSCDLFLSRKINDAWINPRNLGTTINSPYFDSQASISSDNRTIYFSSSRPGGYGKSDIYQCDIIDGRITTPKNIGSHINTEGSEEGVFIHPDNQTLYFTSTGHIGLGGSDIYMCKRQVDGSWGNPINLGYPINTSDDEWGLTIDAQGSTAYFASDREGGQGEMDIYKFEVPAALKPKSVTYLKGIVYNIENQVPLSAKFELIDVMTNEVIYSSTSDESDGDFFLCLPSGKEYALNVSKDGFLFYSDNFKLTQGTPLKPFKKNIPLQPIKKGVPVVLKNIFFDTDKYELKKESIAELEILVQFLNQNPGINIEISGHTDNQGSSGHNATLSANRAKAVLTYLISKGIKADRLNSKGYGDTKPIADNSTPEGRALNRRTEFMITQ